MQNMRIGTFEDFPGFLPKLRMTKVAREGLRQQQRAQPQLFGKECAHYALFCHRGTMVACVDCKETFNLTCDLAHHYVLTRRHCISVNEGCAMHLGS
eukprot:5371500-Amphidinium_carterae.1